MKYSTPITKVKQQWDTTLPFVLYAMPNETKCTVLFQNDGTLHTTKSFSEQGFVFAPFNYLGASIYIPNQKENSLDFDIVYDHVAIQEKAIVSSEDDKKQHISLVEDLLEKINEKQVIKVVASRKKEVALKFLDIEQLAFRLLHLYPKAFRYMWYHPNTGLWCGASPEILVKTAGETFYTMALAGTKKKASSESPEWTEKEISEQQIVTDAIASNLEDIVSEFKVSNPKTIEAGSLYHIKTEIKGVLKNNKDRLPKLVNVIHPTPAVCGSPVRKAKSLILELEKYERAYYSGFLGPIDPKNGIADLFVNLRCAKIEKDSATIYVGGGIVKGSIPEDEWEETENKLSTMTKVLAPFLKY